MKLQFVAKVFGRQFFRHLFQHSVQWLLVFFFSAVELTLTHSYSLLLTLAFWLSGRVKKCSSCMILVGLFVMRVLDPRSFADQFFFFFITLYFTMMEMAYCPFNFGCDATNHLTSSSESWIWRLQFPITATAQQPGQRLHFKEDQGLAPTVINSIIDNWWWW